MKASQYISSVMEYAINQFFSADEESAILNPWLNCPGEIDGHDFLELLRPTVGNNKEFVDFFVSAAVKDRISKRFTVAAIGARQQMIGLERERRAKLKSERRRAKGDESKGNMKDNNNLLSQFEKSQIVEKAVGNLMHKLADEVNDFIDRIEEAQFIFFNRKIGKEEREKLFETYFILYLSDDLITQVKYTINYIHNRFWQLEMPQCEERFLGMNLFPRITRRKFKTVFSQVPQKHRSAKWRYIVGSYFMGLKKSFLPVQEFTILKTIEKHRKFLGTEVETSEEILDNVERIVQDLVKPLRVSSDTKFGSENSQVSCKASYEFNRNKGGSQGLLDMLHSAQDWCYPRNKIGMDHMFENSWNQRVSVMLSGSEFVGYAPQIKKRTHNIKRYYPNKIFTEEDSEFEWVERHGDCFDPDEHDHKELTFDWSPRILKWSTCSEEEDDYTSFKCRSRFRVPKNMNEEFVNYEDQLELHASLYLTRGEMRSVVRAYQPHNIVTPAFILEPLKVRTITKAGALSYYGMDRIQKQLWRTLVNHPTGFFDLIGNPLEREHIFRLTQQWDVGKKFVSGDYSSATDLLHADITRLIIEHLLRNLEVENPILWQQCVKTLCEATIDYDQSVVPEMDLDLKTLMKEMGLGGRISQKNGQLMGHVLSFPVLCIANYCAYHLSRELHLGKRLSVSEMKDKYDVLINGDDIAFVTGQDHYDIWMNVVQEFGFLPSLGKNHFSDNIVQLNSITYYMATSVLYEGRCLDNGKGFVKETLYGQDFSFRERPVVVPIHVPYLNFGLLTNRGKGYTADSEKCVKKALSQATVNRIGGTILQDDDDIEAHYVRLKSVHAVWEDISAGLPEKFLGRTIQTIGSQPGNLLFKKEFKTLNLPWEENPTSPESISKIFEKDMDVVISHLKQFGKGYDHLRLWSDKTEIRSNWKKLIATNSVNSTAPRGWRPASPHLPTPVVLAY